MNAALARVDNTVKSLFAGLKERRVEDCVNVIIVSDHGMATYDPSKLVHLKEVNMYYVRVAESPCRFSAFATYLSHPKVPRSHDKLYIYACLCCLQRRYEMITCSDKNAVSSLLSPYTLHSEL